jgi:hypothetical protein
MDLRVNAENLMAENRMDSRAGLALLDRAHGATRDSWGR